MMIKTGCNQSDCKRITGILAIISQDTEQRQTLSARAGFLLEQKYGQASIANHNTSWCSLFLIKERESFCHIPRKPDDYLQGIHFYQTDPPLPRSGHYLQVVLNESGCLVRNDPVGLINLYYRKEPDITLFGTSSMDMACLASDFQLNEQGILEFLVAGYPLAHHTFYRNISLLPAGCEWRFCPETLPAGDQKKIYGFQELTNLDQDQGIRILTTELSRTATEIAGIGYPCCDLTGGFDSRGILCGFIRSGIDFSTVVNGIPGSVDVLLAARIAGQFGLDHRHNNILELPLPQSRDDILEILNLTDGEIEFGEYYHTCRIQQLTRARGWLTVNGSGGELFRGYWYEGEWPREGKKSTVNIPYLRQRILLPGQNLDIFSVGASYIDEMIESEIRQVLNEQSDSIPDGRKIDHLYLRLRMERWLARYYSATNRILPCSSPFLAAPVLSVALSMAPDLKKRNRFFKKWLTAENRKLAAIPTDSGAPALPPVPSAIPYYWRYPGYLLRKAGSRLRRKLLPAQPSATPSPLLNRFLQMVFADMEPADFLRPENMISSALFSRFGVSLPAKQPDGRQTAAISPAQLARIVTMELTLRQVLEWRQQTKRIHHG